MTGDLEGDPDVGAGDQDIKLIEETVVRKTNEQIILKGRTASFFALFVDHTHFCIPMSGKLIMGGERGIPRW